MSKELPYFRFYSSEWQNGDIGIESYKLKGLFMDICAYYWIKDCTLTLIHLKKRFRDCESLIGELIDLNIIKQVDENIEIMFLDEQMKELTDLSEKRKKAGSKGGKKFSKWTDVERKKGLQLYVLLFSDKNEMFIKVGVTENCIAGRYSVPNGYDIKTIYQYFSNNVVNMETEIHEKLKEYSYIPKRKFGGYLECFRLESIDIINKILKQKENKPLINIEQTISELQTNYKQTPSYKDKDKDKDKDNKESVKQFYELEKEKANGKYKEKYLHFIKYLFGENDMEKPLTKVLELRDQVSFNNFCKLMEKIRDINNKKGEQKVILLEMLMSMYNTPEYLKGKVSLYLTLNNWINRER